MNCNLLKLCRVSFLLFFFNSCSFAQNNNQAGADSASAPVSEDSINNNYENVADTFIIKTVFGDVGDSILKWKQGREFDYMVYLDSLLRKKAGLRIDTVNINNGMVSSRVATQDPATHNNTNSFLNSFPVKFFFWVIAIFFVGFILYKLFFAEGLFAKANVKADNEPAPDEPKTLNEYAAYSVLIQEAELKNDFSLSVRYRYLQSLKKLADMGLITFSADKTNNYYIQELAGRSYYQEFAALTHNYEYVWYGRFAIDITHYQKLKSEFILFNKKL